jgi:hypothetical protein
MDAGLPCGDETWEPGNLGSLPVLCLSSQGQVAPSKDRTEPILLGMMTQALNHLEAEAGGYL